MFPQVVGLAVFYLSKIDLLASTNSFIKRLVANFVNVNKIRFVLYFSKTRILNDRERKSWCIIVKNGVLSKIKTGGKKGA